MKKIYLSIIVLLVAISSQAQVPQAFSYQAVIRNTSNALVANQLVSERISLVKDSATGTVVYSETQNVKTNANGLVSLQIGTGSVLSGSFSGINWATGTYFIKTETDPTGQSKYTISNTTQLLSVPYALQAGSAPSSNLKYPDGFENAIPILFDSTLTSYTVPVGKNFYFNYINGGGMVIGDNDTLFNANIEIPILLEANQTVHAKQIYTGQGLYYAGINSGFIVNKTVEVVYKRLNGSYVVPNGKTLYLLTITPLTNNSDYYINGIKTEQYRSNSYNHNYSIPMFPSGTIFSGQGFIINGYLR